MLSNKNVLIGISGGIAAHKIPELIRILKKNNNNVKTVMTEKAFQFLTKITVETLSQNKVYSKMFDSAYEIEHISLSDWADLMIMAPATANIIGKISNGIADDLLSSVFTAFNKKIFVCPSMNEKMYLNEITQSNIRKLAALKNVKIIEPGEGVLACGVSGKGRMPEPQTIFDLVSSNYSTSTKLAGKKILITAGPTKEYIDPIRFISNDSSGIQGFYIANECVERGAEVVLITGHSEHKKIISPPVKVIDVVSAENMFEKVKENFDSAEIFISAAAVSDYRISEYSNEKLKKKNEDTDMVLKFRLNPDILAYCGKNKTNKLIVGFAAETGDLIDNALKKLIDKNCDIIIANYAQDSMGKVTNKIKIIRNEKEIIEIGHKPKNIIAFEILNAVESLIK
ncbi:MAG TPA: bifunctional phosphopantothenoylcysteine decarboxylase/phosphopantothenate--cysteine ligase CoaBC [bacterium]|nr:bifunctional phosphopantothenoylcysteine decarboxylase/phosphopantothenate--cysteine ligase CoaBC [bacterium]HPN29599.1 bifunctional phosphopantothenoylcysteine decarboxylase/phosphopantothenate--cysteine ligase CoaBC [bacterium]